jgi:tetratricopeptide (TPR) repeat protein
MFGRLAIVFVLCGFLIAADKPAKIKAGNILPLTTKSPLASDLFERAMVDYENMHIERALVGWRAATKADPDLALAYTMVAMNGLDPQEARSARERANLLAAKTSTGEKLLISWISNVQEGNFIKGIAAMNDLLAMYPKDKRLHYIAGNWLMYVKGYDQSQRLLEKALSIDKNYPPALNDLAYVYAHQRQFDRVFAAMDRYVVLLPNEPNPQDSYGELSRMAGNFEAALEHYRTALKIDPQFVYSQLGLADTYALMGNYEQARTEYDKAIAGAENPADHLEYRMQRATTWVRDARLAEADKDFSRIADDAHASNMDFQEAEAQRRMGEYQAADALALKHLESAEQALGHNESIAQSDREQELSRILRFRAVRAQRANDIQVSQRALAQLEALASKTRDGVVQSSWHGARGALLMQEGKYPEAIAHLAEDQDDPYSLGLLSQAYAELGDSDARHEIEIRLRGLNVPTIEHALVVPAARAQRPKL